MSSRFHVPLDTQEETSTSQWCKQWNTCEHSEELNLCFSFSSAANSLFCADMLRNFCHKHYITYCQNNADSWLPKPVCWLCQLGQLASKTSHPGVSKFPNIESLGCGHSWGNSKEISYTNDIQERFHTPKIQTLLTIFTLQCEVQLTNEQLRQCQCHITLSSSTAVMCQTTCNTHATEQQ